jgi:hypothetical protein
VGHWRGTHGLIWECQLDYVPYDLAPDRSTKLLIKAWLDPLLTLAGGCVTELLRPERRD